MAEVSTLLENTSAATLRLPLWRSLPQVVRYGVAACSTQVVYLSALAAGLWASLPLLGAMVTAQVAAMGWAFPLYRGVVFEASGSIWRQLARFWSVWWSGMAISFIGVPLLVHRGGVAPMLAQILVLGVVGIWSFLGHRFFSFRR